MGNLTKNLSVEEFACKCNFSDCNLKLVAHMPLVQAIQQCADHLADKYTARIRVTISGPNRCAKHNALTPGSSEGSMHVHGIAADHYFEQENGGRWKLIPPTEVYAYYDKKYPTSHGLGLYDNRVHLDTRAVKARWNNSNLPTP